MNAPLLAMDNLHVRFGGLHAVRGVSLAVRAGESLGIVGESGSGKTATMLSALGLHDRRAARVAADRLTVVGTDVLRAPERQLRALRGGQVGMVFQDPLSALNPLFTAGFQIAEVLRRHRGLDRARARADAVALLARVGVPDPKRRADQYRISSPGACGSA